MDDQSGSRVEVLLDIAFQYAHDKSENDMVVILSTSTSQNLKQKIAEWKESKAVSEELLSNAKEAYQFYSSF